MPYTNFSGPKCIRLLPRWVCLCHACGWCTKARGSHPCSRGAWCSSYVRYWPQSRTRLCARCLPRPACSTCAASCAARSSVPVPANLPGPWGGVRLRQQPLLAPGHTSQSDSNTREALFGVCWLVLWLSCRPSCSYSGSADSWTAVPMLVRGLG